MSSHQPDYLLHESNNLNRSGYLDDVSSSSEATNSGEAESSVVTTIANKLKDLDHTDNNNNNNNLDDSVVSHDESNNNLNDSDLEHLITNIINEHDKTGEIIKNIEHEEFIEATGADTSFNSEIDDVAMPVVAASLPANEDMNYVIIESESDRSNSNNEQQVDEDKIRYQPVLDDSISSEDQISKSGGVSDINEKSFADEEPQDMVVHHDDAKNLDDSFNEKASPQNDDNSNNNQILNNQDLNDSVSSSANEYNVDNKNLELAVSNEHSKLHDSYVSENAAVEEVDRNYVSLDENREQIIDENNENNASLSNESVQEDVVRENVINNNFLNESNLSEENHKANDSINNDINESLNDSIQDEKLELVEVARNLNISNLSEQNLDESIQEESVRVAEENLTDLVNDLNEDSKHENLDRILIESIQEETVRVNLNESNASEETQEESVDKVDNNLLNESNASENSSVREPIVQVAELELVNKLNENSDESLNETKEEIIVEEEQQDESAPNNESVSSKNETENEEKLALNESVADSVNESEHQEETKQVEILEKSDESIEYDPSPSVDAVAGENEQQQKTTEKEEELFDKVIAELNNQINETDETREAYINSYKLNEHQFDLVIEFFTKHKNGSDLLNINLLRQLMNENLKNREHLHATEDDVWRSLQTIDQDNDEFVNLDEFMSLLLLFYSSKYNLNERLNSVLRNMYQDRNEFSSIQSSKIGSFFDRFFGRLLEDEELHFDDNLTLNDLVNHLSSRLEENAFVKW